jgi:polyisoprenoid-binding protein YceI
MKKFTNIVLLLIISVSITFAQAFKVNAKGTHTFDFKDDRGRNQALFYSSMPIEDINGMTNAISGSVTLNVEDLSKNLNGKIVINAASLKTGIDLRDEHLRGEGWLNTEKYPEITFEIKNLKNIQSLADNKVKADVVGSFTLHGVTKEITANIQLTFLDESEQTQTRIPGDLLGVTAEFEINLQDFGMNNSLIGQKVAEKIQIKVNMVGSNYTSKS